MCVFVIQSCPTLCNPMDCSPPGSSVCGILQTRILEWVAISFPRDLPDPGIEPESPALQVDSSPPEPPSSCSECVISLILSSVSLFSSVSLVCCLFLQECFSFATVFSSSDWFFYSFSSSLIKLCSSILFLSSVSILITNALDSLSGACVLGMDWGMYWGGWGKPDSVLGSFNLHPLPCFSSKQACACSSWRKSRFLTVVSFTDFHTN